MSAHRGHHVADGALQHADVLGPVGGLQPIHFLPVQAAGASPTAYRPSTPVPWSSGRTQTQPTGRWAVGAFSIGAVVMSSRRARLLGPSSNSSTRCENPRRPR
jgi:hypothetical protein